MNSRKNSGASLLGDYAVAPDDNSSDPDEKGSGKNALVAPKKSRFGIEHQKHRNGSDKSPSQDSRDSKRVSKTQKYLTTLSREDQEQEFSKKAPSSRTERPKRRKIQFDGQEDHENSQAAMIPKEDSKLLSKRVFWPEKKRRALDSEADNSYLEIIN